MKQTSSHIEISKSALKQNMEFIYSILDAGVKFSSVLKGNAYGHGIEVMVPLLEELGVDHIAVFSGEEAYRVKQICHDQTEIMVMGMLTREQLGWAIDNRIEFYVFELERLHHAVDLAIHKNIKARVHLELETGMNRTGLSLEEFEIAIDIIENNVEHLELYGVCSHLAGAESDPNFNRIARQINTFNKVTNLFALKSIKPKYKHISCSASSMQYPETHLDLVRIGIMQYGYFSTQEIRANYFADNLCRVDPFKRVLSWKSQVMSIKKVKSGEYIGYSTTFLTSEEMLIAIIPIGYSSGFVRSLSNQGKVLIKGQYAQVVGFVSMNSTSVDISNIPNVQIGDAVTIIGIDGEVEIAVSSFDDTQNQMNYEVLFRLPSDIPRIVVD